VINVLIVEDSAVVREFLIGMLTADPQVRVIGTARSGEEAVAAAQRLRPDVITMDIQLPGMDGFAATRRIMETTPVPIVIVSGTVDPREVATTFRAMEVGAVAVVARPYGLGHPHHAGTVRDLVQTVKLMAEVKVVRRWAAAGPPAGPPPAPLGAALGGRFDLVAIGASTGGPAALGQILAGLRPDFAVPVVIVQHIAAGFTPGLVDWLAQASPCPVQLATAGLALQAGHVYVAPDGAHLGVGPGGRCTLAQAAPVYGMRPAVAHLFRSLVPYGARTVAVLLTGMGKDGAAELKVLYDAGATTIAQDAASSVVHGMPGAAIALGAAQYIRDPASIAELLGDLIPPRRML